MASPEKHAQETMDLVFEKIKNDENINIVKHNMSKPKEVEKYKGFYSIFTEFEIEFDNVSDLLNVCFDYMPSSVEILEPEKLELDRDYLMGLTNDVLAKLHEWDMLVKNFYAENRLLKKKLQEKSTS